MQYLKKKPFRIQGYLLSNENINEAFNWVVTTIANTSITLPPGTQVAVHSLTSDSFKIEITGATSKILTCQVGNYVVNSGNNRFHVMKENVINERFEQCTLEEFISLPDP